MLVAYVFALPNWIGFIQRKTKGPQPGFTCRRFPLVRPHWHPCKASGSFSGTRPSSEQAALSHASPHTWGPPVLHSLSLRFVCYCWKRKGLQSLSGRGGKVGLRQHRCDSLKHQSPWKCLAEEISYGLSAVGTAATLSNLDTAEPKATKDLPSLQVDA